MSGEKSKLVTSPHAIEILLPGSTKKIFDELLEHITNNSPDNEILKSRLSEGDWVPGKDADEENSGDWRCAECNGKRTSEEPLCPKLNCKGVSHHGILKYLEGTGFDFDEVNDVDRSVLLEKLSKTKIVFRDS